MELNPKTEFEQQVTKLVMCCIMDRSERMGSIRKLINSYIASAGSKPDAPQLDRLADCILREELTDPNPYKVSHNENPIMSMYQLNLRQNREVSLKIAEDIGTDGKRYTVPKRRWRSPKELLFLDEQTQIRNVQRALQYEKDIEAGPVITYPLHELDRAITISEPSLSPQQPKKK